MKAKLETSSKEQAERRDETKFGVRDGVRDDPVAVRIPLGNSAQREGDIYAVEIVPGEQRG